MRHHYFVILVALLCFSALRAQRPNTQFNGFGHVEYSMDYTDHLDSYFILGEHDFFVTSRLTDKISFLGEYVIRFNSGSNTTFLPSIERSFVKFNYKNNHNLIVGKIHTPINYWNDVYHHGRLFFPTIDRPTSFSYLVPLHTLGLQFQGQNLGKLKFGYDVVIGNGIASSDVFNDNVDLAYTVAFHIKPKEGMRLGASYYRDFLDNNTSGVHSGHAGAKPNYSGPRYKGPLHFSLYSLSLANFTDTWEFLNEFNFNQTRTDSLGTANNLSNFLYAGYRIKEKHIPFVKMDYMDIAMNDLYNHPFRVNKVALGYRHEFSPFVNIKAQLEFYRYSKHNTSLPTKLTALEVQLAYGF